MSKVNSLGAAKPNDKMFKRGYTVNVAPNAVNKNKPAPAKPTKK